MVGWEGGMVLRQKVMAGESLSRCLFGIPWGKGFDIT